MTKEDKEQLFWDELGFALEEAKRHSKDFCECCPAFPGKFTTSACYGPESSCRDGIKSLYKMMTTSEKEKSA